MKNSSLLLLLLLSIVSVGFFAGRAESADSDYVTTVGNDGNTFMMASSHAQFTPWGNDGIDIHDTNYVSDMTNLKSLGANVIRIFPTFDDIMTSATTTNSTNLGLLKNIINEADSLGIYLDITGLMNPTGEGPSWYDSMSDTNRWAAQAVYWGGIADTVMASNDNGNAVFCYDLCNEPIASTTSTEWYGPPGDWESQALTKTPGSRTATQIVVQWIQAIAPTIKAQDTKHPVLVTFGMYMPQVLTYSTLASNLDFLSPHIYLSHNNVAAAITLTDSCAAGEPILVEETAVSGDPSNSAESQFIEQSNVANGGDAAGWIGHWNGLTINQSNALLSQGSLNVQAATQTSPIEITTATANSFVTGQAVDISGVGGNTAANTPLSSATWTITNVTNASPIQITVSPDAAGNYPLTGQAVGITGVGGNTAANGYWNITSLAPYGYPMCFTLNASNGNGAWTSGGSATYQTSWSIVGASNASPIQIQVPTSSLYPMSGQVVNISGVQGNTAANGTWTVTSVAYNPWLFNLNGSTGNGTYTSGGTANAWAVTGATNASPIVITTASPTGLRSGQLVSISGVNGNLEANGTWVATPQSATTFALSWPSGYSDNGSGNPSGNGTFVAGSGTVAPAPSRVTAIDSSHFDINNSVGNAAYTSAGTVGLGYNQWFSDAFYETWISLFENVQDLSFEDNILNYGVTGTYSYFPTGDPWTFPTQSSFGSGLVSNGSAFGNPNAPDGTQAAFLQGNGTISQSFYFETGKNYTLSFQSAQRPTQPSGHNQSFNVTYGSSTVPGNGGSGWPSGGTCTPTGSTYATYTSGTFTVSTSGFYTLTVNGQTSTDSTVFIDRVSLTHN